MWLVDISEESDGLSRYVDSAPGIHVKHLASLFLWGGLDFSHHAEPSVIINDVDTTESNFCGPKSVFDVIWVGYVHLEDQELTLCPRLEEVLKHFRSSRGGDDGIPLFQGIRGEGQAKAGGCPSDCAPR